MEIDMDVPSIGSHLKASGVYIRHAEGIWFGGGGIERFDGFDCWNGFAESGPFVDGV